MSFHWSHLQNSFRLQSLIYSFKFNVKRPGDADTELPVFTGYKHTESTLVYVVFYLILSVLAFRYLLNPWLVYITYVQQKARGSNLAHHLMLCGLESSTCMCVFFFFYQTLQYRGHASVCFIEEKSCCDLFKFNILSTGII